MTPYIEKLLQSPNMQDVEIALILMKNEFSTKEILDYIGAAKIIKAWDPVIRFIRLSPHDYLVISGCYVSYINCLISTNWKEI